MSPRLGSMDNSMPSNRRRLATHLLPLAYGPDILHPSVEGQRRLSVAVDCVVLTVGWERPSLVCRQSIRR